jgi:hypothetical protein
LPFSGPNASALMDVGGIICGARGAFPDRKVLASIRSGKGGF